MPAPVPASAAHSPRFRRLVRNPRPVVQGAFLALCLWIGVDFWLFVRWLASGGRAAYSAHPAGAEGFLPIAALVSLRRWLATGAVHGVHPAGLFIFVAILALGLLLKKAFCSWMCPVGTLGDGLAWLGRRWLGCNLAPPRWLDLPLRGVKYLLLAFFLYAVGAMAGPFLEAFLDSPYYALADLRMYLFFARISGLALGVILVLAGLSVLVRNAWCRWFCPYGALLGLLSLASPLRITRNKDTCIDCQACTRACPARIQVHQAGRVGSDECSACYRCVQACPVQATLEMRGPVGPAVPAWVFALLAVGLFVAVAGLAMATGHWRTSLTPEDYLRLVGA